MSFENVTTVLLIVAIIVVIFRVIDFFWNLKKKVDSLYDAIKIQEKHEFESQYLEYLKENGFKELLEKMEKLLYDRKQTQMQLIHKAYSTFLRREEGTEEMLKFDLENEWINVLPTRKNN